MPIMRVSKQVWKLVMIESIETDVSASVIMDRLLAEVLENARQNGRGTKDRDKKRNHGGDKKYVAGVIGLIEAT